MKDYSKEFRVYLNTVKGVSDNTLTSYMHDLSLYLEFLQGLSVSPLKADEVLISSFIKHLQKQGKSYSTQSRTLASVRCYYKFLVYIKVLKKSPVTDVKIQKHTKKLPEILSFREIELLFEQPDITSLKGCRDKAMLELLYATGIKVTELILLKVTDVNLELGVIHITAGKNGRIIPLYPEAANLLNKYYYEVRKVVVTDDSTVNFFTNMNGDPMTRQGFWKIIKQYAAAAKIKKDITPHTLRHSFAAHLLQNGAPLEDIKEILGHSDLSSTKIYAEVLRNRYTASYKKYHPMAR